jgi:hypothetical protein
MQNYEILQKAYYRKIISRGVLRQAVIRERIRFEEFDVIMAGSPFPEDAGLVFESNSESVIRDSDTEDEGPALDGNS